MEYDNDRKIKRPFKIVIIYWSLFVLVNPLVCSFTLFWRDSIMWPVLLAVSLVLLPAYLFYAGIFAPAFLFKKRKASFILISILFFAAVLALKFALYSIITQFKLTAYEYAYFRSSAGSIAREVLWGIINIFLAAAIYFIKRSLQEKELLQSLQKDNNSFHLKYLRSQLNPHFLFNTLNSIYALSLQQSEKTPEMVVKLADLMRYLLYECNEEKVPLDKEIGFIRNYIEIEKVRYKADVRFSIEGNTKDIMIEPLLFISFIENGFKHAFDNSFTEPFIYITIKAEAGQVVLNVINNTSTDLETQAKRINGKGISNNKGLLELLYPASYELDIIQTEKEERAKSNVRLKNAKERLETLYPDSHTLDVILSNNAFTVSLILKTMMA